MSLTADLATILHKIIDDLGPVARHDELHADVDAAVAAADAGPPPSSASGDGPAPEPVPVADQRAAGIPPEETVTIADQRAGVPPPDLPDPDTPGPAFTDVPPPFGSESDPHGTE